MTGMTEPAEQVAYSAISKTLHWLIALLAFSQLAMGKLADIDAKESPGLFGWHTSLGLLVLALMLVRIGWRLTHDVPALPPTTPAWQRKVARTIHFGFYALLIALPFSGWLLTSAAGDAVTLFGVLPLPRLMAPAGDASESILQSGHELLGNLLLALAGVHVLAGLKHHYMDRDNVLRRMLPG
jgi:cytochrome b561